MLGELSAGYSGLKTAFDIVKGLNAAHTASQIQTIQITLQQHILDAQRSLSQAGERETASTKAISDLKQQIVSLKDWSAEKERYELKRYYPGSFAFALKPEVANGEPPHRLCAHCYEQGKKVLLQARNEYNSGTVGHRCPLCKNDVWLSNETMPDA